jgi:hypothetical protein
MLAAYLRGLLKPDYSQGIKSVYRENLILQSIAREQEAEEIVLTINNESNYSPLLSPTQANKLLKHQNKMLSLAFENLRHKKATSNELNVDVKSVYNFAAMYNRLKRAKLVGVVEPKE